MHTFRTVILTLIVVLIVTFLGGIAFIYSGLFDVSARWQEGPLVKWVLVTTRERSLDVRKDKVKVPDNLDDPAVIMAGFKYFRRMCVICHSAPGLVPSDLSRGLNPPPPDFAHLKEVDVDPPEYFLIIRNGIRMTAMPAWGITHSDTKIWSMVGFLRKLPNMTPAQYQTMNEKAGPMEMEDEEGDAD
jgi:mono/diheme cytochrome c family protein